MSWLHYEFEKVKNLVLDSHRGQMYGEYTYEYHLSMVAAQVWWLYGADREICSKLVELAWLHDTLEDNPLFYKDNIESLLPSELQESVDAISKRKDETRTEYLQRCMSNPYAHKVKIADTLSNLEHSVKDGNTRRIKKYTRQLEVLTQ